MISENINYCWIYWVLNKTSEYKPSTEAPVLVRQCRLSLAIISDAFIMLQLPSLMQ